MGIIADIVGALASAPVMAAGGTAKGIGDAVQLGAKDMPTLNTMGAMLSQAGEMGLAAGGSIKDGIGGMDLGLSGVDFAALGRGISGRVTSSLTPGSAELSQSLARAPEIQAPTVAPTPILPVGMVDMNAAALFTAEVSAPTFGAGSAARGTVAMGA